jgi:plasmid stability protein
MTDRKPQDQEKFIVRLPEGMRERIKAHADQNGRSMNAEIVATLEAAYPAVDHVIAALDEFVRLLTPGLPEQERTVIFDHVMRGAYAAFNVAMDNIEAQTKQETAPKRA